MVVGPGTFPVSCAGVTVLSRLWRFFRRALPSSEPNSTVCSNLSDGFGFAGSSSDGPLSEIATILVALAVISGFAPAPFDLSSTINHLCSATSSPFTISESCLTSFLQPTKFCAANSGQSGLDGYQGDTD